MLELFEDLRANVRYDNRFHSIRQLIQPNDPEVKAIAQVLHESEDFVQACQDFVHSFTTYELEQGDFWALPRELLAARAGDCDDKAILLVSLLRNFIAPLDVYCAVGTWRQNGKADGHMWVVMANGGFADKIVEATASSRSRVKGSYNLLAIFNDLYAFSCPEGLKEFDLVPVLTA